MKMSDISGVTLPKTKISKATFDALVKSCEDLFGTKGYFSTTVNDITSNINMAAGTFYIYFESKYSAYEWVLAAYQQRLKTLLKDSMKDCTSREERERAGLKTFLKESIKDPKCYNLVWESLYVNEQLFEKYYSSFARSYARSLTMDSNELNTDDYLTLAYALMGINNFIGLQARFNKADEDEIDRITDSVIDMLKKGIFKQN